jgi:hypothetical protein
VGDGIEEYSHYIKDETKKGTMNQTKVEWNLSADAQTQYSFVQHEQPSTAFKNIVCSTLKSHWNWG